MSFDQKIQIWQLIATAFAAFGTVSATVVALYLGLRNDRIKFRAYVGLRHAYQGSVSKELVLINVTNLSFRPITLNNALFIVGKKFVPIKEAIEILHKKIEPGEEVHCMIEINSVNANFSGFENTSMSSLRLFISTTVGKKKFVKPEEGFIKYLENRLKES